MDKPREELAGVAIGNEFIDKMNALWYEYSQEGMIFEDLFKQTIIDVISGQYYG